jgi:hypothetical protein
LQWNRSRKVIAIACFNKTRRGRVPPLKSHKGFRLMLQDWTHELFAKHVNTNFVVQHPSLGDVTLELVAVSELRETPRQRMFSLVFRGPLEQPLEQGLRPLSHEAMGNDELFLVPIAREADGFRYEAVFNNLVK